MSYKRITKLKLWSVILCGKNGMCSVHIIEQETKT